MSPTLLLLTIIAYFILLFSISWLAGRKADNAGFFSGNRSGNYLLVAMSTIGAAISGVTFVSVPGMVQQSAFSYMQMVLGFTVGQLIVAYVLVPLYYKMNLTSIYEYLNQRFGVSTYRTGAWFFFISKMLGAGVRLFVVSSVLQLLVFGPLHLPFVVNVFFTVFIVWLCTFKGGVKSLIWTDLLKTLCLIFSVVLCIVYVLRSGISFEGFHNSEMSRVFFFDDIKDPRYFWKQFLAGIFLLVATTGLDQDLMQRTLSCKNYKDSQKNILIATTMQFVVILLFLVLGWLLYSFASQTGISLEGLKGDDVFPYLATGGFFPTIVGVLFIVGFIAAAYSAAGSALTALTTSFTVDILGATRKDTNEQRIARIRSCVHIAMAVLLAICIYVIWLMNDDSVIQTVYKLASYTYGPLLGMFCFGILTKRPVRDRWIPLIAIASPLICFLLDIHSVEWFNGYVFSHERLILNALFTFVGMWILSCGHPKNKPSDYSSEKCTST